MTAYGQFFMAAHKETQEQARKLLNSQVETITALAKTRQRVTDLQEQLNDAQREEKKAYVKATKDGWSADELKKMGLENNAATSRRRNSRRSPSPENQPAQNGSDTTPSDETR